MKKLKDLTENQVVQTTNENDKQFRELLHKDGLKWCNSESYLDCDNFGTYETMCYHVSKGEFCNKEFYERNDKEILQASDFLTPKINKSELLERIEVLEEKVAELTDKTNKVTIVYPPIWANEPGTVIGKGTIEVEADKTQFETGTLGAFWDGDWDECLEKGTVLFGKLDHITENGHFRRKGASWSYYNFKPLKFD